MGPARLRSRVVHVDASYLRYTTPRISWMVRPDHPGLPLDQRVNLPPFLDSMGRIAAPAGEDRSGIVCGGSRQAARASPRGPAPRTGFPRSAPNRLLETDIRDWDRGELIAKQAADLRITWGERWDLNPRHPGPQPGALPTELRPPCCRPAKEPAARRAYRALASVQNPIPGCRPDPPR
jgi:hypothetical protein